MPSETKTLIIEFENVDSAEAGARARELEQAVLETDPSITTKRESSDRTHQELGTILTIVLGARAVVALANGIAEYLKLRRQTSIRIKCGDGELVASNVTEKQAAELADLIMERC
jgi:hypothetical protein